jgi:phosphotransferase system enzyme I (PtsI)
LSKQVSKKSHEFRGFPISPGIAIGNAAVFDEAGPEEVPEYRIPPARVDAEISRFKHALNQTRSDLEELIRHIEEELGESEADIFRVQLSVMDDPSVRGEIERLIVEDKYNVESALSVTIEKFSKLLSSVSDKVLRERASDIRDLGRQLLAKLMFDEKAALWSLEDKVIVVARELSPAITVRLDRDKILGFVADSLGPTSHAAILARSLEVPSVGAVAEVVKVITPSDILVIDGFQGLVFINPTKKTLEHYRRLKKQADARKRSLARLISFPSVTRDGEHINLAANIGKSAEVAAALKAGADGVGLYRTEFPFLSRRSMPSEQEQFEEYRHVVERMAPKEVTIRVLDAGGDKFPSYIPVPRDTNPYLGWRGIRLLLRHKDIFKTQLRAILRASQFGAASVLYPVVSGLEELRMARMLFEEAASELRREKIPFSDSVRQGVMIEVPSAVVVIDMLLREADFLSVGTNDLIQYVLAINRNSESLAPFFDPFHPAVLRVLRTLVRAARRAKKGISICGEVAGEPTAVKLLLGLGFRHLSMAPASILAIKEMVRKSDLKECRDRLGGQKPCRILPGRHAGPQARDGRGEPGKTKMTRCLVIGHRGMLGSRLFSHSPAALVSTGCEVTGLDLPEIDITDAASVTEALASLTPDVVINCAAYTDVDGAESHRDDAFMVNAVGPELLARAARGRGCTLVHISTDFIFDGEKAGPYVETDGPNPVSAYGKSKLAGETAVTRIAPEHLIIRTAWLYGPNGRNFVDTILGAARQRGHLRVVNDQRGSPTFTGMLASVIWRLLDKGARGVFHVAGTGSCTWFDLARAALDLAGVEADVEPVTTDEFRRPARRPKNSVLDCTKAEKLVGDKLPVWQAGLKWHLLGQTY